MDQSSNDERVRRYAEAIRGVGAAGMIPLADAVMAVADAERADDEALAVDTIEAWKNEAMALRQGLWDAWVALGHDTDGDTGPGAFIAGMGVDGFIGMVISDATTWRKESEDDYANDTDALEERVRAAEAKVARVEALRAHLADPTNRSSGRSTKRGRVVADVIDDVLREIDVALAGPADEAWRP